MVIPVIYNIWGYKAVIPCATTLIQSQPIHRFCEFWPIGLETAVMDSARDSCSMERRLEDLGKTKCFLTGVKVHCMWFRFKAPVDLAT